MTIAVYYSSDGFRIDKTNIMGRQVAGNTFLKAFFKYTKFSEFYVYSSNKMQAEDFYNFARAEGRNEAVKFIDFLFCIFCITFLLLNDLSDLL